MTWNKKVTAHLIISFCVAKVKLATQEKIYIMRYVSMQGKVIVCPISQRERHCSLAEITSIRAGGLQSKWKLFTRTAIELDNYEWFYLVSKDILFHKNLK